MARSQHKTQPQCEQRSNERDPYSRGGEEDSEAGVWPVRMYFKIVTFGFDSPSLSFPAAFPGFPGLEG